MAIRRDFRDMTAKKAKSVQRDRADEPDDDDDAGTGSDASSTVTATTGTPLRDVGLSGAADVRMNADRLAATLDSRIAESMPVADVAAAVGSQTSGGSDAVADAAAASPDAAAVGSEASRSDWIGGGRYSGWSDQATGADQITGSGMSEEHMQLARDYLSDTGRYDADEVSNMSEDDLREAMKSEATRELLGYEGPMDTETAAMWFEAENSAFEDGMRRDYLIGVGYDPAEVNMMDSETLRLYTEAEGEVALAGGEPGPPSGSGDGPKDGSMSLADRESGETQMGDGEHSGDEEGSSQQSESDSSSDDDDDDDDDDDGGTAETSSEAGPADDESEGNSEGSGADPGSSTPRPDQDDYNPAEKAAFLQSRLGAESRDADMDAIGNAIGGGLIVGDGEDPGARQAWFDSDLSAGERALAGESVAMARGGGVTDPADGDDHAEGLSEVNLTRLPNFGLIDPVDAPAGGGTPIDPITGAPALPPRGPAGASPEAETMDDASGGLDDTGDAFLGSGVAGLSSGGGWTGSFAGSGLAGRLDDLDGVDIEVDVDHFDVEG
jgi:hypothetical protein